MPDEKFDVKRVHRALYAPSAKDFVVVDVPPMRYLAVDGHGDPNTEPAYAQAVEALFSTSYTLKFRAKAHLGLDAVVAPLEGLWRAEDPAAFATRDTSAWSWTMLLAQPEWVDDALLSWAVDAVRAKAKHASPNPALDLLRLVELHEGRAVQILHVGSYNDEGPTLARLHNNWMPAHGVTFNGDHHEMYLNDPRRTAPEKLRTILRQPVRDATPRAS